MAPFFIFLLKNSVRYDKIRGILLTIRTQMSRIGKQPIVVPAGVTITVGDKEITVAGPKGSLNVPVQ